MKDQSEVNVERRTTRTQHDGIGTVAPSSQMVDKTTLIFFQIAIQTFLGPESVKSGWMSNVYTAEPDFEVNVAAKNDPFDTRARRLASPLRKAFGDGTTSLVLMIAEGLREAKRLTGGR